MSDARRRRCSSPGRPPTIGVITLNRPERLNALTHDVVDALVARLTEAGAQPDCRVLVLTGAGRGFCAGLDITANVNADGDAMRSLPVRMAGQETVRLDGAHDPDPAAARVAAVNGAAAGAGMGLALACDVRVAAAIGELPRGGRKDRTVGRRMRHQLPPAAPHRHVTGLRAHAHRASDHRSRGRAYGLVSSVTRRRRGARSGARHRRATSPATARSRSGRPSR